MPAGKGNVTPFTYDSARCTYIMKSEVFHQALDAHNFDAAINGARRDEGASRAKERISSVHGASHHWAIQEQRPEFWGHYNIRLAHGEPMRVFPLSNGAALDV